MPENHHSESSSLNLVTTSWEALQSAEHETLYLGPWCEPMQFDPVRYRTSESRVHLKPMIEGDLDKTWSQVLQAESEILPELASSLNRYHRAHLTHRDWQILVGPWLRQTLQLIATRLFDLRCAFETFAPQRATFASRILNEIAPLDTWDAASLMNDQIWSSWFDLELVTFLLEQGEIVPTKLVQVQGSAADVIEHHPFGHDHARSQGVAGTILKVTQRILVSIRPSMPVSVGMNMGAKRQLLISLFLGGAFSIDHGIRTQQRYFVSRRRWNWQDRPHLLDQSPEGVNEYSLILRRLVRNLLPAIFLEDFEEATDQAKRWKLPPKSNFVTTSVSYYLDEMFKLWLVRVAPSTSSYLVLQHGNNYGTHRWFEPYNEETTADAFLTWGWKDSRSNIVPWGISSSKLSRREQGQPGIILLQLDSPPSRCFPHWRFADFELYMLEVMDFLGSLTPEIRSQIVVRPHTDSERRGFAELSVLKSSFPEIESRSASVPITSLWSEAKLVVHSYDSTGLLECLASGRPTVAFWNHDRKHWLDSVDLEYAKLHESRIVHRSGHSAGLFLRDTYSELDAWWQSDLVLGAREQFIAKFAAPLPDSTRAIARSLRTIADHFRPAD